MGCVECPGDVVVCSPGTPDCDDAAERNGAWTCKRCRAIQTAGTYYVWCKDGCDVELTPDPSPPGQDWIPLGDVELEAAVYALYCKNHPVDGCRAKLRKLRAGEDCPCDE